MRRRIRLVLPLAFFVGLAFAAAAQAADQYVDPGKLGRSDAAVTSSAGASWCSLAPALRRARSGDAVHLASGTDRQQVRPLISGTPGRPSSFVANGAVTIALPEGTVAVMLAHVHDLVLRAERRHATVQGTAADALGSALSVNDASLLVSLDSQTNWFSSTDTRGRNVAWNGSRMSLADWRTRSLQDTASFDSSPPRFSASGRVTSDDLGAGAAPGSAFRTTSSARACRRAARPMSARSRRRPQAPERRVSRDSHPGSSTSTSRVTRTPGGRSCVSD